MAQHRRGVWTGQSNDHGVKTLYARMDAPDAIRLIGQINRVADALAAHGLAGTADTRRAAALGLLADPIQTSWLLAHHTQPHIFDAAPDGTATPDMPVHGPHDAGMDGPPPVTEADIHPSQHDLPGDHPDTEDGRGTRWPGQHVGAGLSELETFEAAIDRIVDRLDLNQLRPTTQLIVHTASETLERGHGTLRCQTTTPRRRPPGNAPPNQQSDGNPQPMRVEDLGPLTLPTVQNWLLHHRITLQPVIDLNHPPPPVDTYEIPQRHRNHITLRSPASRFCWSTSTQGLDRDHVVPYLPPDQGGPPGQTGLHNLVPLSRHEHRLFTHANWQRRQPEPDTLLARTPHGQILLTNNTGTHDLGNTDFAHTIWTATAPSCDHPAGP